MRGALAVVAAGCLCGCVGSGQQTASGTTPDPAEQARAVEEVTQLAAQHCADGIHGTLDHVATEGSVFVRGTAGEVMEGRALLESVNQSYRDRGVEVRYLCDDVQRWVFVSPTTDVAWVEEAITTHATFPDIAVQFPAQRTMVFEHGPEGWRLRFYALSVRLPDEHLDEVYGLAPPASGSQGLPASSGGGAADGGAAAATAAPAPAAVSAPAQSQ